ncbi:ferredoxin [Streptomyces griseochromogenes]|uniref:Ferredoxin n=1 Tax=Streptomyces griseochromogenes TaxID=68214 RepID=A0A1B1ANM5_9ACTN|nr:ferredoxin [Streptomyces griseochromogenes]ANP48172.1 ferredoxin [Streptomyces griseochromogenes]MBP2050910.1 ferredoxin [Streptomyces griseochromogenes]
MKVSVDRAACYGSAECAHRAPSVFGFEDGYGLVRSGQEGAGDDPQVREAAEKCPSQAIVLTR